MNHSMVSHSFQGKSQLFSWTQKVPHHWGLSLPVFPFLTNAPWQLPRQLHQTAEQFLEHPLFFFFPPCSFDLKYSDASVSNVLSLFLFAWFTPYPYPSNYYPSINWNCSGRPARPALLSCFPSTRGTSLNEYIPLQSLMTLTYATEMLKVKRPRLWALRAPGRAWYRTMSMVTESLNHPMDEWWHFPGFFSPLNNGNILSSPHNPTILNYIHIL